MNVVVDIALAKNGRARVIEHGCERGSGGVKPEAVAGAGGAGPGPGAS